jgi:hypothetical protein
MFEAMQVYNVYAALLRIRALCGCPAAKLRSVLGSPIFRWDILTIKPPIPSSSLLLSVCGIHCSSFVGSRVQAEDVLGIKTADESLKLKSLEVDYYSPLAIKPQHFVI